MSQEVKCPECEGKGTVMGVELTEVRCSRCFGRGVIVFHPGVKCPQCGQIKVWKHSKRRTPTGQIKQRYLCSECGLRFTEK